MFFINRLHFNSHENLSFVVTVLRGNLTYDIHSLFVITYNVP
jgi:hypothetical protein